MATIILAPLRSTRLVKKALHRTPTVATTQNMLIKKLDLFDQAELKIGDFESYILAFQEGLLEDRVRLINELFVANVLATELQEDDDAMAT
jgi:hypothetical protein